MDATRTGDVTRLLKRWSEGDVEALDDLVPVVYDELHHMAARYMRRERGDHTLQATSLVNEAYLHLRRQGRVSWHCRAQFFGVAATVMSRVLLHHAEHRGAQKRGGDLERWPLDEGVAWTPAPAPEMVALSAAVNALAALDGRQARIVELRFFLGLTTDEIAELLEISDSTVKREWRLARAWLKCQLAGRAANDGSAPARKPETQP